MGDLFFVGEYELGVTGDICDEEDCFSFRVVHAGGASTHHAEEL
jgi:hypothetical protein